MNVYVESLENAFRRLANPQIDVGQKAYMKNRFEFFGIKTPDRRAAYSAFLQKDMLPPKNELVKITRHLWLRPEREFHYFTQELTFCY